MLPSLRAPSHLALAALAATSLASAQTGAGELYTLTNEAAGNQVAVFDRATDGTLTFDQFVSTGGLGSGDGLGNQGAVVLTADERFLLAVNAGSSDISVFRVEEDGLTLVDVAASRGARPISLTVHDGLVYVVNAGTNSIAGFTLDFDGDLRFLWGSLARLSAPSAAPAQIQFGPRGEHVYVSEKATQRISRFAIDGDGLVAERTFLTTPSATPFGFALGLRGQLLVSEAQGGAAGASTVSSFVQLGSGDLQVRSASVGAGQSAACWITITPDGRIAYASNTGDDTVSSFLVGFDGGLTPLEPVAATVGDAPLDMAITRDGRFFYVLNRNDGSIGDYTIGSTGGLTGIPGTQSVLPTVGISGLAVR